MESIVRNVNEIQSDEKRSLEDILGQPLEDHQRVLIMVLEPDVVPDDAIRRKALAELKRLSNQGGEHAKEDGVSESEANASLDEAMRHVRPRGME